MADQFDPENELDELLAEHKKRVGERLSEREQETSRVSDFTQKFSQALENTVKPTLENMDGFLNVRGFQSSTVVERYDGSDLNPMRVVFTIRQKELGSTATASNPIATLTISGDPKAKNVSFSEKVLERSVVKTDSIEHIFVENLTEEAIQRRVIDLFGKFLKALS